VQVVIDRLPVKVAEVAPPVVLDSKSQVKDGTCKTKRSTTQDRPAKGSLIDVKFSLVGWCKGVVKSVYGDTFKVYFDCDKSTPTLNWKKVKWRWR